MIQLPPVKSSGDNYSSTSMLCGRSFGIVIFCPLLFVSLTVHCDRSVSCMIVCIEIHVCNGNLPIHPDIHVYIYMCVYVEQMSCPRPARSRHTLPVENMQQVAWPGGLGGSQWVEGCSGGVRAGPSVMFC